MFIHLKNTRCPKIKLVKLLVLKLVYFELRTNRHLFKIKKLLITILDVFGFAYAAIKKNLYETNSEIAKKSRKIN